MKLIVLSAILLISPFVQGTKLLDYRLVSSCGPTTPIECTTGGKLCETCTSLVHCSKVSPTGDWIKTHVETCKSPKKCINGQCVEAQDPICDGTACYDFVCKQAGIFPDQFFWNRYVMCVNTGTPAKPVLKPYVQDCEDGFAFNVKTGHCDLNLKAAQETAPYPVKLCTGAGDSDALPQNNAYYFICQIYDDKHNVLYPVMFHCPGNAIYRNKSVCS